MTSEQ